jgi:hypothetical protein
VPKQTEVWASKCLSEVGHHHATRCHWALRIGIIIRHEDNAKEKLTDHVHASGRHTARDTTCTANCGMCELKIKQMKTDGRRW